MMIFTAAAIGLLVLGFYWLSGRCQRLTEMKRIIHVEKGDLFRFLCDPDCLKIIHPYTTGIRLEVDRMQEGGTLVKRFVWEENLPFAVQSLVSMRCDPSTSTIIMDVTPAGGMFKVQLTWCCADIGEVRAKSCNSSSDSNCDAKSEQRIQQQSSGLSENNGRLSAPIETDKRGLWKSSCSVTDTLFENRILLSGPRAIIAPVAFLVTSVQMKLMDKLQQYFLNNH